MTATIPTDRATVSVPEAARILGIGRNLGYHLAKTGELPTRRLGRRLVVSVDRLRAMLEADGPSGSSSTATASGCAAARHPPSAS